MRYAGLLLVFGAGYFLSYLFRTVNAVLAPELTRAFGLDAAALGLLTSVYFMAFAASQLPLGLLLDRFGPRRVEAALLLFAALGAAVFATAHDLLALLAGRALIGFGVSACMMAGMKAVVDNLPRERLALGNAAILFAGGLGAVSAATPVALALEHVGWRALFWGLAALTLSLSALLFLGVKEHRRSGPAGDAATLLRGLRRVLSSQRFWQVAPVTILTQSVFMAIAGLWMGPWLRQVNGLDKLAAANHVAATSAGMATGFLAGGLIADRLARRGIGYGLVAGAGLLAFMAVQAGLVAAPLALPTLPVWFLFGALGSTGLLSYALLNHDFPAELAGRVTSSLNVFTFVSAFLIQYGFGQILELFPGKGAGLYDPTGYRVALAVLLSAEVASYLWFCRPALRRCGKITT